MSLQFKHDKLGRTLDRYIISEVVTISRKGTMQEKVIDSHYLHENMKVMWYQPESFSPLYKYRICLMQDGNDYFQLGRIATLSDRLHGNGQITNTIFIGIHYRDKHDRREKYHPDGEQNNAYMQFLIREVVPLLDNLFPTLHMGKSRTLLGDSLAGTLALMTSIRYPNTFGQVIMQSPYVDDTVLEQVKEARNMHTIDFYHTIGTKETAVHTTDGNVSDFLEPNRELQKLLASKNLSYTYHELDGDHTWKTWQKDLPEALKTMLS